MLTITTTADTNSVTSPVLPAVPPCRLGVPPGPATRHSESCRPSFSVPLPLVSTPLGRRLLKISAAPAPSSFESPRQPAVPHHASRLTLSFLSGRERSFPFHGSARGPQSGANARRLGHGRAGRATTSQRRRGTGVGMTAIVVAVVGVVGVAAMCRCRHHIRRHASLPRLMHLLLLVPRTRRLCRRCTPPPFLIITWQPEGGRDHHCRERQLGQDFGQDHRQESRPATSSPSS